MTCYSEQHPQELTLHLGLHTMWHLTQVCTELEPRSIPPRTIGSTAPVSRLSPDRQRLWLHQYSRQLAKRVIATGEGVLLTLASDISATSLHKHFRHQQVHFRVAVSFPRLQIAACHSESPAITRTATTNATFRRPRRLICNVHKSITIAGDRFQSTVSTPRQEFLQHSVHSYCTRELDHKRFFFQRSLTCAQSEYL